MWLAGLTLDRSADAPDFRQPSRDRRGRLPCNRFGRCRVWCGMGRDPLETFRDYLQSLPEDLLESVTEDYVWLAGLTLDRSAHAPDFRQRRECCREECVRRGAPQLYEFAEDIVSPHAA